MKTENRRPALWIAPTAQALARRAAEMLCRAAVHDCRQQGYCCMALSGGTTPRALFALLTAQPRAAVFPWRRSHFFWVDERMLAYDHEQSNFGAARRLLFDHVEVPQSNLNPMPVEVVARRAAAKYEKRLRVFFRARGRKEPVFDVVLLGLGADGHTASLFPGASGKGASGRWVRAVQGGEPAVARLTLTETVLNQARRVLFLVSGSAKAPMVKSILESGRTDLPAGRIRPQSGDVTWLLDYRAAALLDEKTVAAMRPPADAEGG